MDKKLGDEVTLKISDLKNLFLEGKQRGQEEIEVDNDEREEDHHDALDFGDYLKSVHNIIIID